MKSLEHPHVLKVRELFEDNQHFYIVMDKVRGTNLAEFLFTIPRDE